jgi:hypothetical protein
MNPAEQEADSSDSPVKASMQDMEQQKKKGMKRIPAISSECGWLDPDAFATARTFQFERNFRVFQRYIARVDPIPLGIPRKALLPGEKYRFGKRVNALSQSVII